MSGQISQYGANQLLTAYFGKTATVPSTLYFAAMPDTAIPPSPFVDGTELSEILGSGYARVAITNNSSSWTNNGTIQTVTLAHDVNFPTATDDWGNMAYWALTDAATGGNVLMLGTFDTPQTVSSGDTFSVLAGTLTISLGDFYSMDTNG